MIEVKLQFPDEAALVAYFTGKPLVGASATVTPEKQAAAIASTKVEKTKAVDKPKDEPKAEKVEDAKPARTYETSGLSKKIADAQAKDKTATVALLVKHGGTLPDGRPSGKALKADVLDAFEAEIDALLAPSADLS